MDNNKINFCSIKPRIRMAENIMREFHKPYTYNSPSIIHLRYSKHVDKQKTYSWLLPLQLKVSSMTDRLENFRKNFNTEIKQNDFNWNLLPIKYFDTIKNLKIANCGELSNMLQLIFAFKGIKTNKIILEYIENLSGREIYRNHSFLAIDLGKSARISNPKTWSSKAIVIDPWLKFVKPSKAGLDEMAYRLGVSQGTEACIKMENFPSTRYIDDLVRLKSN